MLGWRGLLVVASLAGTCRAHQPRRVSVSGQSAGASFAIQHLVAFSETVDGAGLAAGSPYGCGALPLSSLACYYGWLFPMGRSLAYISARFRDGLIDDPANLWQTPVVLFNGLEDEVVSARVMRVTLAQLGHYVEPERLTSVFNTSAAHVWSLDHGDCACGACSDVDDTKLCCDVNNCGYDLSGDVLGRAYGRLRPRARALERLHWVDQWRHLPAHSDGTRHKAGLLQWALVYLPSGCEEDPDRCRVHINYHGCTPRSWDQRRLWALSVDLNEYGEANDIIVVYPQAAGNPLAGTGCWNWFPYRSQGYWDPLFDTRQGAQLQTVVALVADLRASLRGAMLVPNSDPVPVPGESVRLTGVLV